MAPIIDDLVLAYKEHYEGSYERPNFRSSFAIFSTRKEKAWKEKSFLGLRIFRKERMRLRQRKERMRFERFENRFCMC